MNAALTQNSPVHDTVVEEADARAVVEGRSSSQPEPPARGRFETGESVFRTILWASAIGMVVLLGGILLTLIIQSFPAIKEFGLAFVYSTNWDPVAGEFGALPFLAGTLITSFLAIIISTPFSLAISLFLGEYFREGFLSSFMRSMIELLAGIPSVIYGFWALFYLVPLIRSFQMQFNIPPYGVGILAASAILAVMIIPYSASIAREVISMVPWGLKEAAYSLGSTRFEVVKKIVIPYARSGIFAGMILALGRALGETMAVTMVIGNRNRLTFDIFSPANTMASVIANEFTEATGDLYLASLIEIGLLLFVVSMITNIIGKEVIKRLSRN